MLYRLLVFSVIVSLVVMSCSKENTTTPDDPIVEIKFDSVEYVKATIDGVSYSELPSNATTNVPSAGELFFAFNSAGGGGVIILNATVADTGKGVYTLGPNGDGSLGFSHEGIVYTTVNGATGTLTIDKIDIALKRVKGRFSGTVKSSAGATKTVADGTFEVKW